jgi:phosphoribosylformylglycinamidine synthase
MFNDFKGYDENGNPVKISVPPTLLISSLGIIEDVRRCVTLDAKLPDDVVFLVGNTRDELGGSEYCALMGEQIDGRPFLGRHVPRVEPESFLRIYQAMYEAIKEGLVASCTSVGLGGLGLALCRTALGGDLGLEVDLTAVLTGPPDTLRPDKILYSESQGRLLVTVSQENSQRFASLFRGLPLAQIGHVTRHKILLIHGPGGREYLKARLDELRRVYKKTLDW